jgi:hypothetical protein
MSRNINVNPDHYKTRGRERQGEDIIPQRERAAVARAAADSRLKARPKGQKPRGKR